MATAKSSLYPADELKNLKEKKKIIAEKITALQHQILEQKDKERDIDKKIFALEDGRLLRAVKEVMEDNAEVSRAINSYLERMKLLTPDTEEKAKRGRPPKAGGNATANFIADKVMGQQGAAKAGSK